jgi:RNA polymerase sigma-70 factor (ECF subfamily)
VTVVDHPTLLSEDSRFIAVLAGARAGDDAAFAELWRDHNPGLLRFLSGLSSEDEARDVASTVWLEVVRKLHTFDGDAAGFRAWIFTIARSRLIDLRRSRNRRISTVDADFELRERSDDSSDPSRIMDDKVSTRDAIALISKLPEKQAEVVLLRVVADLDVDTVASMLGKSAGVVRVLSHRGLKRLAELVTESGVTR